MSLPGHDWRVCELCGHAANEPEVKPRVLLIKDESTGKGVFVDTIQCKRVEECRARCEASGRSWPVLDSRWLSERPWRHGIKGEGLV